ELKIDRSFIIDIESNEQTERVLGTLVLLAQQHDMEVVVEGIETPQQLELIEKSGCDRVQGYLTGKPLLKEDAIDLLCSGAEVVP
ncbi:MAG TPA: EAL domain-containing protein, partial [Spirochaetota bacterium]|nr:EAL domain-containing protein [Spirochaetota bacterium]